MSFPYLALNFSLASLIAGFTAAKSLLKTSLLKKYSESAPTAFR
jgi:hypothetical protein